MSGRPAFGISKGGGEIPWYAFELPVIGISVNLPTMLADMPMLRTYINAYDYESLFRTSLPMDKKQRIQTYSSLSSHAMTLIAVDIDPESGKTKKWMVENSWGPSSGYQGNMIMTDEWFNEYMFRLVVEKKYVPADIMRMLEQKPIMLPSWDPMFAPEE